MKNPANVLSPLVVRVGGHRWAASAARTRAVEIFRFHRGSFQVFTDISFHRLETATTIENRPESFVLNQEPFQRRTDKIDNGACPQYVAQEVASLQDSRKTHGHSIDHTADKAAAS